ncbi:MAG: hypothetical protein H0X41_01170 [Chitinophagaceae bacterium]|nr:hypothetical protein [Chitinophagaceae bacterium]
MNGEINMEEMLWNYIDGSMNSDETSFVETLLQSDATWKAKYNDLLDVHTLMLESIGLDQPSMRFTQNVMEEISKLYITPAAANYINRNVIWGIGIFFLTTIAGLLAYGIGQTNWSEAGSVPGMDKLGMSKVDWSKLYNNSYTNIFIMVNIVLGLMLLDMYLTKKKKIRAL